MSRDLQALAPPVVTVNELYRALKDTNVDHKVLLVCMGVEPAKIREFERSNHGSEDRAFMDSLEYFLNNKCSEEGKEWNKVIDALEFHKDMRTAENIRRTHMTIATDDTQVDDEYFQFIPAAAVVAEIGRQEDRLEYLKKMKTKAKTEYNAAQRNIDDCHYDIQRALDSEHEETKKIHTSMKLKVERNCDKLERDIQDLIEQTAAHQRNVQEAINRLKRGDCTGLATIKESSNEIVDLERLKIRTEKSIERHKRSVPQRYIGAATIDNVIQDLQAILITNSYRYSTLDDNEYKNINNALADRT